MPLTISTMEQLSTWCMQNRVQFTMKHVIENDGWYWVVTLAGAALMTVCSARNAVDVYPAIAEAIQQYDKRVYWIKHGRHKEEDEPSPLTVRSL